MTAFVLIGASTTYAQPSRYRATELVYPDPDLRGVYGADINDQRTIVGFANVLGKPSTGFVYINNQFVNVYGPNGTTFIAEGINNFGDIVGYASPDFYEPTHAWLISENEYFDLGALEGSASYAHAISDTGEIVGRAHDDEGESGWSSDYEACSFNIDQTLDFMGYLGFGMDSSAWDVNDLGITVGHSSINRYFQYPRKAFVEFDGFMFALEDLGGGSNYANAINNSNMVAGGCETQSGISIAVAWENGFIVNALGTLGGRFSNARDVNDDGIVVGSSEVVPGASNEAFVCRNNIMFNVNDLLVGTEDVTIQSAEAINNNGDIVTRVSRGEFPDAITVMYLLTPEPNPGDAIILDRLDGGIAGVNTMWATNVTEGAVVYLAYGLQRGTVGVPGCPGLNADIRPVLGVIQSLGRNGGEAFFPLSVPEGGADRAIIFQVFEPSSCRKSVPGYVWFDG